MTSERTKLCSRLTLTKAAGLSSRSASSALREVWLNGLRLSPACQSLGPWHAGLCLSETGRTMSYYAYLGPLGEVVRRRASFVASKDGFLIGTYDTFGEAMESLAWKGRTKAFWLVKTVERSPLTCSSCYPAVKGRA